MTGAPERVSERRRLAALGALVGTAALVGFVVGALFRHGSDILIGLVGLAVAVTGAWWVVTERLPRRAIGAAGVLAGLVVVAVAVARALGASDGVAFRVGIVLLLLGVTMACARAAMERDLHRDDPRRHPDGPPRRAVLLCNPWSGEGMVERFGLPELAAELGVETVMLERGLDLEALARDAVARGADCLGVAGGDGSQAVVAAVAVEHDLPFVCVSAGTRNHFALDLGLDRDDPRQSMWAFRDAYERRVDYGTVNGRLFVNNVSLGVYATVVQEDSYRDAKLDTTTNLLPELLGTQAEPFDLQFATPDGQQVDGAIAVVVSNNTYTLHGAAPGVQRLHLDRGELGVFAATTRTGAEAARLLAAAALGERRLSRFWHEFTATEFEVQSRSGVAFAGVDGEPVQLATPLRFQIHPGGLTMLVPRGNVDAARRRSARDARVGDLVDVALGREPPRYA